MNLLRHTIYCFVVDAILLIAPFQDGLVQICYIPEGPAHQEIVLHKAYQTLHLSLGKRMPGFAELCLESNGGHECLIIFVPQRMPFQIPAVHNTAHIVGQHRLRDPHIFKGMKHTDEQVFLLGVRKELHIPLSAMVADHCKARCIVCSANIIMDLGKTPVHLVNLARPSVIPETAATLGCNQLPLGRDEILVASDVSLYAGLAATIARLLQSAKAHCGVLHTLPEKAIQHTGISTQNGSGSGMSRQAMWLGYKSVLFQAPQFCPGDPGTALQFSEIDL